MNVMKQMEMKSRISYLLVLQSIINGVIYLTVALPAYKDNLYKCRDSRGNYTDITYKKNLHLAMNFLSKETGKAKSYFYHTTVGDPSHAPVNVIALCQRNIKPGACDDCMVNTGVFLRQNCPDQKEAVAWGLDCMIRYSDRKMLGVMDDWVWMAASDPKLVGNVTDFNLKLNWLLTQRLSPIAAAGDSTQKYGASGVLYVDNVANRKGITVYAAMQCTPDLSKEQCSKCLFIPILMIASCCSGNVAARYLSPNCYLRYSHEDFIQ